MPKSTPPSNTEGLREAVKTFEALSARKKLVLYEPNAKQALFHQQGATHTERLLMAGNQQGKTTAGGAEGAMHALGRYPDWWKGKRFDHPTRGWVSGISNEQTRDNAQRMLYGPMEAPGTGFIPAEAIINTTSSKGLGGLLDTMLIKHTSGGISYLSFKSYEQGRLKFQGDTLDWVWCDEEPPVEIFTEILARLTATRGLLWITFTPLLGMTDVVELFFPTPTERQRALISMTIEDATHIPEEDREAIIARYPEHEREARIRGIPILGSGRVFPIAEERIRCEPIQIPKWWKWIVGIDFGWDHPTAIVWCAWDPEGRVFYVTDVYAVSEEIPAVHAAAIRSRGPWMPVAWPHDAYAHDKRSGIRLRDTYTGLGVKMLPEHANQGGLFALEAGVVEMLTAMREGLFKVFATCAPWWTEFRTYHRKKGEIVKRADDLMSATRYAFMSKHLARHEENLSKLVAYDEVEHFDPLSLH